MPDPETLKKLKDLPKSEDRTRPLNEGRTPSEDRINKAIREGADPKRLSGNRST